MSTRMGQELYERRMECLKYHVKGVAPSVWTEDLGKKYGVAPKAIWRDWNNREHWLNVVVNMKNPELVMQECIAEIREAKKSAWLLRLTANQDGAKAAALKIILDANDRLLDLAGYGRSLKVEGKLVGVPNIEVKMFSDEEIKRLKPKDVSSSRE